MSKNICQKETVSYQVLSQIFNLEISYPSLGDQEGVQDSEKYADTTSFVVTAVMTNLVVAAIGLVVTARLVITLQPI